MFIFCFFFKQKTAYEMRISDWSSDVVLFRSDDQRAAAVELFLVGRQLRDDPVRAYQPDRAWRDGSLREGRHRQLDDPRQDDQGHGRRDGARRRLGEAHRRHGAYGRERSMRREEREGKMGMEVEEKAEHVKQK